MLEQQVKRMLADPRAEALVNNFAAEWLFLRNLQSVNPAGERLPEFRRQPAAGLPPGNRDVLRQRHARRPQRARSADRRTTRSSTSAWRSITAFPNIYGSQFRRVTVTDEARRGLLGQGSMLTVTSYPTRTSPVLRGKWILENIMGTPPPAPPPNVPPLKENDEGGKALSVRERLEEHRKNPACATCHAVMDPLGFSLENFDAVGQWRTKEAGLPIDASGQLADGTKVNGSVDAAEGAPEASRAVRRHDDREADDLRARARPGILRHAGGSWHRARRGDATTTAFRRS